MTNITFISLPTAWLGLFLFTNTSNFLDVLFEFSGAAVKNFHKLGGLE